MKLQILSIIMCASLSQISLGSAEHPLKALIERINTMKKSPKVAADVIAIDKTKSGTYALIRSTDGEFLSEEVFFVSPDGTGKVLGGDTSFEFTLTEKWAKAIPKDTQEKFVEASKKRNPPLIKLDEVSKPETNPKKGNPTPTPNPAPSRPVPTKPIVPKEATPEKPHGIEF